jgi:hypothetical protein
VVVLINSQGAVRPDALTREIVRAVVGDGSPKPTAFRGHASDYAGLYAGAGRASRIVIGVDTTGAALTARIGDGPVRTLTYLGGDTFGRGDTRYRFARRSNRVTTLHFDNVYDVTATVRMPDERGR